MEKLIFRKFEPLWMRSLSDILTNFISRKDISVMDSYKLARRIKMKTPNDTLNARIFRSASAISLELLVLAMENFKKDGINYSLPEVNNLLHEIKKHLPDEFKTMNGEEFLKLLRGSIAHNSESTQNVDANSFSKYQITLPKKGATPIKKDFTPEEIMTILYSFDQCRILTKQHGCLQTLDVYENVDQVLKDHKKYGSFSKFIRYFDKNGKQIDIDKYQETAFLRFLIKHRDKINKLGNFNHFITRYFPAKDNKINQYEMKYQLLLGLGYINNRDYNKTTCREMLKNVKNKNFGGTLLFMDEDLVKATLYSSIAFNIFSSRTNDELKEIFENAGYNIAEENIRHVRNSFIHGRYFFNFKEGFELYDGTEELQHITTITFADIDKIIEYYCKNENILHQNDESDYIIIH